MRVAIIQETVDTQRGGAETSTLEMARQLAALGLDVTVIAGGGQADAPGETSTAARIRFIPLHGASKTVRTRAFVQAADEICRAERFDIVHAVTPCLSANVYQPRGGTYVETIARSAALVSNPMLRWLKNLGRRFNARQQFLLATERALLTRENPPFVAAVSQYVKWQVESAFPVPQERVRVVFNGVDFEPLSPEEETRQRTAVRQTLGLAAETPLILFVAHNFKLKGLPSLLAAFRMMGHPRDPSWRDGILAIAGRDRPQSYQRLARKLGIAERVRFLGADTPVRTLYAAADVLAHPTWYDPCSRVVLEALCAGLPVVTTRCNGAAEIMEPGRHGWIVTTPAAQTDLAVCLNQALQPAVRAACRADAPRLREHLSMARHARELKALYEEIAAIPQKNA